MVRNTEDNMKETIDKAVESVTLYCMSGTPAVLGGPSVTKLMEIGASLEETAAARMAQEMRGLRSKSEPKASVVVEVPAVTEPIELKDGQVSFRGLFPNWKGADFAVTQYDPNMLPAHIAAMVPEVDPYYLPNIDHAAALLLGWELNDKVLLTGLPGTGKSSLVRHCAALTRRPLIRINGTEDIESSALLGQAIVEGGEVKYSFGPVAEGVQYPSAILLDEWDMFPPGIVFALQWLLEDDGELFLRDMPAKSNAERVIKPHAGCRIAVAGNTAGHGDETGSHAGTRVQNTASLDRFKTSIVTDYLPTEQEIDMIAGRFTKLDRSIIREMVRVAGLIRAARKTGELALTMSPRTLFSWAEKAQILGVRAAIFPAFLNKLPEGEKPVAEALVRKAFP